MSTVENAAVILSGLLVRRPNVPTEELERQAVRVALNVEAKVREANFQSTSVDDLRCENERLQMQIEDLKNP